MRGKLSTATVFLLVILGLVLSSCNNSQSSLSDAGEVRVRLKGSLPSTFALLGEMPDSCPTKPTHLVLRLSYPDGAFYVRKIPIEDLTKKREVTLYAPPGREVILYAVAVRFSESAATYFNLRGFLAGASYYKDPNLIISGYRAYVGEIQVGQEKKLEIDLSKLEPITFDVKSQRNETGSFVAKLSENGSRYLLDLRLHLPWVAPGADTFDPQGPALFAENGYLCLDLPEGEGITPADCRKWDYPWGVSNWGSPNVAMSIRRSYVEEKGLLGHDALVWVSPIYNSGLNYGFKEQARFYLPASTCAPEHLKTYFWVHFPEP